MITTYRILFFSVFLFSVVFTNQVVKAQSILLLPPAKIGNQEWYTENLYVTFYRDGSEITQAKTLKEFYACSDRKEGAWCFFNFDGVKHGTNILYNWWAVNDKRGLAPLGWHIPSEAEWEELKTYMDNNSIGADALKSTTGWKGSRNGTNLTGFNAQPNGGMGRSMGRVLVQIDTAAYFWTTTTYVEHGGRVLENVAVIYRITDILKEYGRDKVDGLSVRLIKDKEEVKTEEEVIPEEPEGKPERTLTGFKFAFSVAGNKETKNYDYTTKKSEVEAKTEYRGGSSEKKWDPNSIFIQSPGKDLYVKQTATTFLITFFEDSWGTQKGYYKLKGKLSDNGNTLLNCTIEFEQDSVSMPGIIYKYAIEVENVPFVEKVANQSGWPGFYQYGDMMSICKKINFYNKRKTSDGEVIETLKSVNQEKLENGSFYLQLYFDK